MVRFELQTIPIVRNKRSGFDCALQIVSDGVAMIVDLGFIKKNSLLLHLLETSVHNLNIITSEEE